jgi:hypothetical protein
MATVWPVRREAGRMAVGGSAVGAAAAGSRWLPPHPGMASTRSSAGRIENRILGDFMEEE